MKEKTKKKAFSTLSLSLAIALALTLGWGVYESRMLKEYKIETENQYKRALNDLGTTLNEVETSMSKVKVASSPSQKVLYLGQTWKGSDSAVSHLGQLPADEVGISYIDTLVNQVGDFSKAMTKKVASVENMSAEEQKVFNDMHERIIEVNRTVQQISDQFYAENLSWVDKPPGLLKKMGFQKVVQTAAQGEESDGDKNKEGKGEGKGEEGEEGKEAKEGQQAAPTSVRGGLQQLDVSLQKLPPFTYQGELDKHYVEKPLGLPPGEINESKAAIVAKEFLNKIGYKDVSPQVSGLSQGPLGGFDLIAQDSYIEVSKKGGVVTYYRNQREIKDRKLDIKTGVDKAYAALENLGWNLVVTSTLDFGSYIQVDAVAEDKRGVRLYPDKVRLVVAMDNGELTGFDANPYYSYHHDRKMNSLLTLEEAKTKLNKDFQIKEHRQALIAKLGTDEAFCYEFRGTAFGEEYLVYINALDGSEEKISRIIESPRGKFIQ